MTGKIQRTSNRFVQRASNNRALKGSFLYDDIVEPSKETCTKQKKKVAQHNTKSVKSRDIRSMFTEVTRKKSTNTHDISSSSIQKTIVIDYILFITFLSSYEINVQCEL